MHVRKADRPIPIDVWHILPRRERLGKRVEQTFFGLINLGNTEDIVNVGHDGQSGRGYQVRCGISNGGALDVRVQSLDRRCLIARLQAVALDGNKRIEITLGRSIVGESHILHAPRGVG